jgi:hypothetical protein
MMPPAVRMETGCPLCGTPIMSVGRRGDVRLEELHPVALFSARGMGQGYLLCEDCAILTTLPSDIALN